MLKKAVNFYQRYAPDDQNPFRSLEVMSNFFHDVETLLPDEQEYEAIKSPVTFMIRTGIRYFRDGIDLALEDSGIYRNRSGTGRATVWGVLEVMPILTLLTQGEKLSQTWVKVMRYAIPGFAL